MIVSAGASVHVDFEYGSCTQQVICTKVNMLCGYCLLFAKDCQCFKFMIALLFVQKQDVAYFHMSGNIWLI
jgi:hypothetical protein